MGSFLQKETWSYVALVMFFGARQSGVPMFRLGDLLRDLFLMEKAHAEAERWLTSDYDSKVLVNVVEATWEERFRLVGVG